MNISFSKLGTYGRLGNQLFQIASTTALAEKHGATVAFPDWKYEDYFGKIPHGQLETKQVKEKYFQHHGWDLKESCDILGYLQTEKYFTPTSAPRLKPEFVESQKARMAKVFEKETICFQIRRGDFVGNPNYFQISINYYIDALITHFPNWKDCNIIFFSDELEYCKVHFECLPNAYFSDGFSDVEQIALASCCDHFIIANSSFGWWCAWYGEKPHSKIVHCGHLQAGKLLEQNDPKDYYPERWTRHQKASYKIPLTDVTFTIPVFYDHIDRKKNLDLSLCMLQTAFDASFIVCELGDKFQYVEKWVKYMKFDSPYFHRTKMLNDMTNAATTDIIVNFDCDVIIPPMQILMAVEALRSGADMVFPYDGRFARMDRQVWFTPIEKHLDIGVVGGTSFKGREKDHNSVGGCVLFNKESFIEGGMENENMISFGPEDCERNDRFKALGYDVRQIGGSLFHMDHYIGPNSGPSNPHFRHNHAELEKIRAMLLHPAKLREYVESWPWISQYTSQYYSDISQGAIRSAKIVMEAIGFKSGTVLDVGCGVGEWHNGNPDYHGMDYKVKKDNLLIPVDKFCECNLNKDFSIVHAERYDLVICLEVAEHLRPHRAKGLIEYLTTWSDKVLFSAAIPFQGGTGHVNEQWQSYWIDLFAIFGFVPAKKQPDIRDNPEVELWYRQNIILFEKGGKGKAGNFVLSEYYMEIVGNLVKK